MPEPFSSSIFIQVGVFTPLPSQGSPLKFLISPFALEASLSSQFDPSTKVMLHFVDEDSNLLSPLYEPPQPSVAICDEPIVPEIPVTSGVAVLQMFACPTVTIDEPPSSRGQTQGIGEGSGAAFASPVSGRESSPQPGIGTLSCEAPGLSQ
ncbi:uncharacterized protein [Malus domestica]|uniref:uncharacterized protein n=1 Tax=Malus domestica TaxID=3750 RepID=UPI003976EE98